MAREAEICSQTPCLPFFHTCIGIHSTVFWLYHKANSEWRQEALPSLWMRIVKDSTKCNLTHHLKFLDEKHCNTHATPFLSNLTLSLLPYTPLWGTRVLWQVLPLSYYSPRSSPSIPTEYSTAYHCYLSVEDTSSTKRSETYPGDRFTFL